MLLLLFHCDFFSCSCRQIDAAAAAVVVIAVAVVVVAVVGRLLKSEIDR